MVQGFGAARLKVLRDYCSVKSWGQADLRRQVGFGNATYWSRIMNGNKSLGEKSARKVEQALGLPFGYLDGGVEPPASRAFSRHAREIAEAYEALPDGPEKLVLCEAVLRVLKART